MKRMKKADVQRIFAADREAKTLDFQWRAELIKGNIIEAREKKRRAEKIRREILRDYQIII